jgi:hypothetical protein
MLECSWQLLEPDPPELRLPEDLRARDVFGGRDCGWVSQMRPFVRAYSRPGDVVFDPFCGREGLGMEIDHARVELTRERLRRHGFDRHGFESPVARIMHGSLPQAALPARIDLCLTNVPYFGCRWPGSAPVEQCYAVPDFERYLMAMRTVFHAVREALPDEGYCIAMVENVRIGERMLPVAWELARILDSLFLACDERMLCYPPREDMAQQTNVGRVDTESALDRAMRNDRSHEYALVYRKRRPAIDIERTRVVLAELHEAGFMLEAHGSFLAWLEADPLCAVRRPSDLDLWVPDDAGHWTRLLQHLSELGFRLTLWGERVNADVALESLRRHAYLRAEWIGGDGAVIRIDLALKP